MSDLFERIVEERIAEARRAGAFDDLPGTGKPLALDDDSMVPEELRMAYRVLKNAGFLPPELEARREIAALEADLAAIVGDEAEQRRALARLQLLRARLGPRDLRIDEHYRQAVLRRFGDGS
ncbi:DnaJ family domain-containing protein [Plasticicumulans acidivorans]|uniref:Uncharacterized protein DUF1992 n=1 Tax=Plasticicumulans acidivorans TaxID=886464 RepID=A0A317MYD0_9GAMM|nr:DnaJ family domain-containing protein [Plasticicumulans acidivorans]PWV63534.1 uncharacterized protein DUF1992 [Plasticicumulans acidivorans]